MADSTAVAAEHSGSARATIRRNRDSNVMAAAITVLSQKGYGATSIQEVADRVGVLKGSLYHYFSSKEELLYRILEESHEQIVAISSRVAELELGALDELLEYVRQCSLWYLANIERANIFFTDVKHLTGDRLIDARGWGKSYEVHIQELVVAAQADGDARTDLDPRMITRFVLGAVNNVRYWPSRSGRSFTNAEIAEALVALSRRAITPA